MMHSGKWTLVHVYTGRLYKTVTAAVCAQETAKMSIHRGIRRKVVLCHLLKHSVAFTVHEPELPVSVWVTW